MITLTTGTPPSDYTNIQWHSDFAKLMKGISPAATKFIPYPKNPDNETQDEYHYRTFINDILYRVREEQAIDYIYFVYQAVTLIRYEPRLQIDWNKRLRLFTVFLP